MREGMSVRVEMCVVFPDLEVAVHITAFCFGSIDIDGVTHEHDVVIDRHRATVVARPTQKAHSTV
jgi:hypothetical protein